jgi:DNA helicase-2/ATP-dependent DNA helicase PcrA
MEDLNAQQREATETVEGPLLVLAGAGSGKTRVITYRIVHLIEEAGVQPWQILAVTFTNKAAGEMKSRVEAMLDPGRRTSSPLISTFHSLCVRILRRDIERMGAGYTRNFTIYDEDDQARLVRSILKDLDYDDKSLTARQALSAISWAKNRGISPAAYANQAEYATERTEKISRIYKVYEQRLQQSNALDFDDLLIKAVELLRGVAEVRAYYHEKFRHVMIDEFQDTNGIQYELARLIAVGDARIDRDGIESDTLWQGRSLCVVGDIDQSVYSFRGADFNIILNFQHDFKGTKIIKLEENYRSSQNILEAANRVIERNTQRLPKTLFTKTGAGEKIRYYQSYDGEGEASFVAEKIQEHLRRSPDARCAVLYRTNSQSRLFEESLRRRNIPYNIVGGFSFYERAEVRDNMALARIINSPPRGIGKTTLDSLHRQQKDLDVSLWETIGIAIEQRTLTPRATASLDVFRQIIISLVERVSKSQPLSEVVKAATLETNYVRSLEEEKTEEAEGRLLNIEELVTAAVEAEEQGETLRDFIDHAALVSDTDQYKDDARVTLMTIHAAKGLEFPVVFIVGIEEGLFPHSRTFQSEEELEEERRLCYVAITRAQKHLYITHAMKRRTFGEEGPAEPSRFLNEIPLDLLQDMSLGPSWLGFAARPDTRHNRDAASALRGESTTPAVKRNSNYTGKTYNSAESVRDFFKSRTSESGFREQTGGGARSTDAGPRRAPSPAKSEPGEFRVGSRVRHAKYGTGVVLRAEGVGGEAKLTVNFPAYGQKKFVAKYAQLEKA